MNWTESDDAAIFRSGGLRWAASAICFTIGVCLVVAASTFVVYLVVEWGAGLGSERPRSVLAIAAFVAVVAVPVSLLVVATAGEGESESESE
jgi:hypothetical protein